MRQRIGIWVLIGFMAGVAATAGIGAVSARHWESYLAGNAHSGDSKAIAAIVDTAAANPALQSVLREQVSAYLRSTEGKQKMLDMLRSPEVAAALAENVQTPAFQEALLRLLENPGVRRSVLGIVGDMEEIKVLRLILPAVRLQEEPDGTAGR